MTDNTSEYITYKITLSLLKAFNFPVLSLFYINCLTNINMIENKIVSANSIKSQ